MSRRTIGSHLRFFAQPTTCLGIGTLIFIYGALSHLLASDAADAVKLATVRGENIVHVYEHNLSAILRKIDRNLAHLRDEAAQSRAAAGAAAPPNNAARQNDELVEYIIAGSDGHVATGTRSAFAADTIPLVPQFIKNHEQAGADKIEISTPFFLKEGGTPKFAMTRLIRAPDGRSAGLALAVIDVAGLSGSVMAVDLGPHGVLSLSGFDRVMRMRVENGRLDTASIGRQLPPTANVAKEVITAPFKAFWNTPEYFDNISRLVTYKVVEPYPLVAVAAIAAEEVFRHADDNARNYWTITALLTLVILAVVGIAAHRERRLSEATADTKRAQAALQHSEERYRKVESAVNDGIWDWNIQTGEDYLSPRWKAILGYAEGELSNFRTTFLEHVHPDDLARVTAAARAHLEEDKPYDVEYRLRGKDGRYIWVQSRGKTERDASGHPARMVGIMTDISCRKQAEAALKEEIRRREEVQAALQRSEERYRKVENAAIDSIWDWNIETGENYFSPRWKALLGYTDQDLPNIRQAFHDLVHPDDAKRQRDAVQAHLNEGAPYEIEYRLRRKDGTYIWVHSRGKAEQDAGGRPVRMVGILTDVSERKRAEVLLEEEIRRREKAQAALQRSEERYRKVENAVNDGIWDRNFLTGEYYLSPRWKAILGFEDHELPNKAESFYRRIHPEDEARLHDAVKAHLYENKPYMIDLRLRCKDGSYVWVRSCGKAEWDASGKAPIRMLGTIRDISDRKRAEEELMEEVRRREEAQAELARINAELEDRVAARSEELAREMSRREDAQMKLAQIQRLEAVGQLTAGIAHDFNNLLSVINGGLEFVKAAAERNLPADHDLIDATMRATHRGGDLIRRLLAFARMAPLRAEPARADQLVLDALRLLQRTLGEKIEIETRLDAAAAMVRVDRNQLINVLVNLALNARDAMPEGGTLTIATACRKSKWAAREGGDRWPTGEEVCITVSDTGVGMPEEVRARAVEPFFTTKPDGLGTGLGLSTVLGFVEQTGGHLDIASEVGKGTQVSIHLPRIECEALAADSQAAAVAAADHKKLVLLVEDDPDMRVITAAQLKNLGYQVQVAANGNEAISVMESPVKIDVTLTDMVLPGGIDGMMLVREALRTRPSMGVLCMSGYDPGRSHRKWLGVQNISLLEKPFTSAQLASALNDAIVQNGPDRVGGYS